MVVVRRLGRGGVRVVRDYTFDSSLRWLRLGLYSSAHART